MMKSTGEKVFDLFNATLMIFICIITLYPFLNTAAISFNDGIDAQRGGIFFWPREFSLRSYDVVFSDKIILNAYIITISRTVLGIFLHTICTGIFAYGLSKKNLIGRNIYLGFCAFCMIFNAGLIPTYMLYKNLGLINNFLVYIIPGTFSVWNMILMKTYFQQLPIELEESARIDGCTFMQTFIRIIVPCSMPIIATMCIFVAVGQWNSWFDAFMYVNNQKLHPIQTYLYKVIALSQVDSDSDSNIQERLKASVTTVRAATVVVTTLPIVFIYSIFQKHFIKGVMVGAVKG